MAVLKYKTRGMVNPQGKQKVYFCCHPDDFARYFDQISDEILNKQNCAIWYLESFETEYDEQFFEDLKGMQLFVVPVTTNFLCTENHAISVEFNFAIENHIPVLPLMQESGLEDIFNQKCGDLQFLDKNNTDATAISYDEKLEKYLSAVLVGDEMAEKIREAFDAYVFLSYRKKDRKYAQELMRLIHKNDFCRDIAIWYDEFLTPGENFNDSIKEALKKSGLFVLTVTPNLVNEINYIMTTEYPMAKKEGKPILPAELVPTDKDALTEKFEGIPKPTDAHEETELSEALLDAVKKIAIKENDNSPEHNFFIGLAYLNGVDVEVDHERAVSLITSSAEAGLVEAMSKLVDMYRSGVGVTRSYETAIKWQEKIIEYYQKIYDENPDEYNLNKLFWEIIYCGDYYKELNKLDKSKEKYLYSIDLCRLSPLNNKATKSLMKNIQKKVLSVINLDITPSNPKEEKMIKRHKRVLSNLEKLTNPGLLSIGHQRLGLVYDLEMNFEKAIECFDKENEIYKNCIDNILYEPTSEIDLKLNSAYSLDRIGDANLKKGDYIKAKAYYEKAYEIRTSIHKKHPTIEVKKTFIYSFFNFSKLEKSHNKAIEHLEKALNIAISIEKETNTVDLKNDLEKIYSHLALLHEIEHNLEQAKEYFNKSLELCISITNKTDTIESKYKLADRYEMLGEFYYCPENDLTKATESYKKAIEVYTILIQDTGTPKSKYALSHTYRRLAFFSYSGEKNLSKEIEYLKKAIEIDANVANEEKTIESLCHLSSSYRLLGETYRREKEWEKASLCYSKCLFLFLKIKPNTQKASIKVKNELAECHWAIGNNFASQDKRTEAYDYYEKYIKIRTDIAETTNTYDDYIKLCIAFRLVSGRIEEKRSEYEKREYETYEIMCKKFPDEMK